MIWWMLQNFIVTAILAGCVWAVCRIWRIGPAFQHALWLVLLVKLVTPPLVSWPWALPARLPAQQSAVVVPERTIVSQQTLSVPARKLASAVPTRSSDWIRDWLVPTVASVWLSGCGIFLLMQGKRIRVMLCLLRTAAPADSKLLSLVAEAARRVRTRVVDTRVAAGIASPFIWCIHRPRLLWPAALSREVPEEAIRGLLVHELAHIKRRDHWVGWLELAAGCLWWWNPLYWYVRHQLRENAELACDAWVVDAMDSTSSGRRAYAEALLAVCESISSPMTAVGANTSNRRFLERRLTMILRERFPLRLSRVGLLIVALIAAGALPMWTLKAASESTVAPVARPRPAGPVAPVAAQGLPNDAQELLKQFEAQLEQQRRQLIEQLQALQDRHTKAGNLDEAVAVRDQVRRLQGIATIVDDRMLDSAWRAGARAFETVALDQRDGAILHFESRRLSPNNLLRYRDQIGQTIRLRVRGLGGGPLWGTDVYTVDSDPGVAAVHAGLLQPGQEGLATIRILPGQAWYSGSIRNGVRSSSFDSFPGSFRIEGMEDVSSTVDPAVVTEYIDRINRNIIRNSEAGIPFTVRTVDSADAIALPGGFFYINSSLIMASVREVMEKRGHIGETLELEVTGLIEGPIWGNGVYTDDSPLETAAVHAGLLKPGERGTVRVTILPGQSSYEGLLQNGVQSKPFGAFDGSYRIERVK